jgi:hypothetical protein
MAPAVWAVDRGAVGAGRSIEVDRLRVALGHGPPVLAQLLPGLDSRQGGLPAPVTLSAEEERFRLFDAVAKFLISVARWQPVVLVIDDLHRADRDSLQLLGYCGRFGRGRRWCSPVRTATRRQTST